jgi:hypothetical protein
MDVHVARMEDINLDEDNIKMDLKKTKWEGMDWIIMAGL